MRFECDQEIVYREYKHAWDAIAYQSNGHLNPFLEDDRSEEVEDVTLWIRENMGYAIKWGNLGRDEIFKFCAAPLGCPLNWLTHDERSRVLGAFLVHDNVIQARDHERIHRDQEWARLAVERAKNRMKVMTERDDAYQGVIYIDQRSTTGRVVRKPRTNST